MAIVKTELDEVEFKRHEKSKFLFRRCEASCKIMQGRELIRVKESMRHGSFGKWIVLELQISPRTAQRLMKLAKEADKREQEGRERSDVVMELGDAAMDIGRGIDPFPEEKKPRKPSSLRIKSDSQSDFATKEVVVQDVVVSCKLSPVNRIASYLEHKDDRQSNSQSMETALVGQVMDSLVPNKESKVDQFKRLVDSMDESDRKISIDWYNGTYGANFVLGRTAVEEATDAVKACSMQEQETVVGLMIAEWNSKALQRLSKKCVTARKSRKELYTEDFEQFWSAFPPRRRTAKGNAMKAWDTAMALLEGTEPPKGFEHWSDYLVKRADDYSRSMVATTEYVKGPESWLNGRCWDDSPSAWKQGPNQYGFSDQELQQRDNSNRGSAVVQSWRKNVMQTG